MLTANEWIGQPVKLLPWEKLVLLGLLEVDEDNRRTCQWAYISVAKKQGKTQLAAWLALWALIGSAEPAPVVLCAAASDDQADLVFGAVKTCVEMSPTLSRLIPKSHRFESELQVPSIPGSRLIRVPAGGGKLDGVSAHCIIVDELHEWLERRARKTWNVLAGSIIARRAPMIVQITTAGVINSDADGGPSVAEEQYEDACRVVETHRAHDPNTFVFIAEPDPDADHEKPETWAEACPSLGVTVQPQFLEQQLRKRPESEFRRYFCNQWVESSEIWEAAQFWPDCYSPLDLDPGLPLQVGIDIGLRHDSSAVVCAQHQPDNDRVVVRSKIWGNPYPVRDGRHSAWALNLEEVKDYLRGLADGFPSPAAEIDGDLMPGPAFFYDPKFFEESAHDLRGDQMAMIEYAQSDKLMVPASQRFFQLVKTGRVAHNGDPELYRHIRSVKPDVRVNGGWRISKPKGSRKKIDGAIAAAIACYRAVQPTVADQSPTPMFFAT